MLKNSRSVKGVVIKSLLQGLLSGVLFAAFLLLEDWLSEENSELIDYLERFVYFGTAMTFVYFIPMYRKLKKDLDKLEG